MLRFERFIHWNAPVALGVIGAAAIILCGVGLFLGATITWIAIGLFSVLFVSCVLLSIGALIVWLFSPRKKHSGYWDDHYY